MPHILLADDDFELIELLSEYLQNHAVSADVVEDGEAVLEQLQRNHRHYDLLVLDIMMPKLGGLDVLKSLHALQPQNQAGNPLPVIMLTAKGDDIDRIIGLELGADDYLAKPCNPRELLARINAVIKRTSTPITATEPTSAHYEQPPDSVLPAHDHLKLDPIHRTCTLDGTTIDLTGTEFDVLCLLFSHYGDVVSKEALSLQVLGRELSPFDRSLDVHISRLRKKLADKMDNTGKNTATETIKSVRGKGYQLVI